MNKGKILVVKPGRTNPRDVAKVLDKIGQMIGQRAPATDAAGAALPAVTNHPPTEP